VIDMDDAAAETPTEPHATAAVNAARLDPDHGDISQSYSADRIASDQPARKPFQHDGALWICTSITGSGLTVSGSTEHEAYRVMPERIFNGTPTTYGTRTGTIEMADAARKDPNGFYHGVTVKHGRETFVLSGPPVRFVPAEIPARPGTEPDSHDPLQLSLF
jgi:hypothetical protein